MTLPHERARAVTLAREFLARLCTPYGDGYKKIPKPIREQARRVLRHFPHEHDLIGPAFECPSGQDSDIASRLRHWVGQVHGLLPEPEPANSLMLDAADEIESLRLTDAERAAVTKPRPLAKTTEVSATPKEGVALTDALLAEIGIAQKYNALVSDLQDEIQSLRSRPCPYVSGTVTRYCTLGPPALTDAEREAVEDGVRCVEYVSGFGHKARADLASSAATLRGLLERLK